MGWVVRRARSRSVTLCRDTAAAAAVVMNPFIVEKKINGVAYRH
ncbi:MAG: hypothetical protein OEN01_09450 [Candidatus Krumholzibacteria bacterium]|nr:hypothetical protein [Candidatus Krumholzibacteria bacterium]